MKKAISFGREIDCYIDALRSVLKNRRFWERADTIISILMPMTPIIAALLASYATIVNNVALWLFIAVAVISPTVLSTVSRHKMKVVNDCRAVWIELIKLKENIYRLAIDGNLKGRVLMETEKKMMDLRNAFQKAIELQSPPATTEESIALDVMNSLLDQEYDKRMSPGKRHEKK